MTKRKFSKFEQLRWLLLDEAGAAQDIGVAYGVAKLFLPEEESDRIEELVKDALLALYDDGLIRFYYASWNEGYGPGCQSFPSLGRAEVDYELRTADVVDAPDKVLFFIETQEGADAFARLPPEAVPRVSGRVPR